MQHSAAGEVIPIGRRERQLVLLICAFGLFMTYVDSSILNVALPTIQRQFRAGISDLQWVLDSYQLVLASLLTLAGSLADRCGRRRIFRIGLLAFTIGSLLCAAAPGIGWLVAFRVVQALGGSMLTPVSLSIVRQVFTDPRERARAIGWWSAVFGLGVAAGPVLGGPLVASLGWRSVFWVNVPVGLCGWVLAGRYLPESRAARPRRMDPAGQLLTTLTLATLTYALIEGAGQGWGARPILIAFAISAVSMMGLVFVERRVAEPLLEPRFFRSPTFCVAGATAVITFLALSGFLFINTLYLQQVRGFSAPAAGVALLPTTVTIMLGAPLAGRLTGRFGARPPIAVAGLCLAGGAAVLVPLTAHTPYLVLAVAYGLLGAGFGLVNPPITNAGISSMPPAQAGVAGAVISSARQVGNTLGVAIMGSLAAHGGPVVRFNGLPWVLAIGCGLATTVLALGGLGPWAQRRAAQIHNLAD
jgi:EmrB/QacA subfamily drug resistance transporter